MPGTYFADQVNVLSILRDLKIGDTISVKVKGMELTNRQIRASAPLTLQYTRKLPYGADVRFSIPPAGYPFPQSVDASKGDSLCLKAEYSYNQPGPEHKLRAPGIWNGTLSFSYGRLTAKCFDLPQAGTFTLVDDTLGKSAQIRVLEEGAFASVGVGSATLAQAGVTLGFGGGRLVIPPGALPLHDGSRAYSISGYHRASTTASYDREQFDGGHQFGVTFDPVPPELLKPITLTLPYTETGRYSPPQISLFDSQANLFYPLDSAVDTTAHQVSITIPAGASRVNVNPQVNPSTLIGDPVLSIGKPSLGGPVEVAGLTIAAVLGLAGTLGVISDAGYANLLTDQEGYFMVNYIYGPEWAVSKVSEAYALKVLNTLLEARYILVEQEKWPLSPGRKKVFIRNLFGILENGFTTNGLTTPILGGDVWILIDSTLNPDPANSLITSTGHEFGHLLERQLLILYPGQSSWMDEAAAQWAAYHGLSGQVNLEDYGLQDLNFPALQFPHSFISGYSAEQAYAAGAFVIWLADPSRKGPAIVRQLYQKLGSLTDYDPDSYPILEEITGSTMENIIRDFSFDFWAQTFEPINQRDLPWVWRQFSDWDGTVFSDTRPPMSSQGYAVAPTDTWKATIGSREGVIRAYGLGEGQQVRVYGTTKPSDGHVGTQTFLGTLDWQHPGLRLTSFGAHPWYRLISVNTSRTIASSVNLEVAVPHIIRLQPDSLPRWGGSTVSILGSGFGSTPGKVMFGTQEFTLANGGISNWWSSNVEINIPPGTYGQQVTIKVITAENVNSDTATFTYY